MRSLRRLRKDAALIWSSGLRAVDPEVAVRKQVRRRGRELRAGERSYDLGRYRRIWVFGAGKAAAPMARAIEALVRPSRPAGLLVTKYGHSLPLEHLPMLEAGHPLPDAAGVAAGVRIRRLAGEVRTGDLVFCLLSGGGSALLVDPAPGIRLEDKLRCTQLLLEAGASIHEMNAVRKHLSELKGGGWARLLSRTAVICLVLSDVVGDDLDTIASGPMVADRSTFRECLAILRRLGLSDRVPPAVLDRLSRGEAGEIAETPKPGDPAFRKIQNLIVGSNALACTASASTARRLGYHTQVLSSRLQGETAQAALFHQGILEEIVAAGRPLKHPACILSGGETTVQLKGGGKGGRNQEFVMHLVRPLAAMARPCLAASIGTDGTDGPTDAAGAVADNASLERSYQFGSGFLEDAIARNDSYHFFDRLGDLVRTGPTRTNVMDLRILMVG